MTAPAEDPRGGEALYPLGRGCCGAPNAGVCHQLGLCWMKGVHPDSPGYRAARPAGDRAQPTEELREQLEQMAAHKIAYVNAPQLWGRSKVVEAVLALPAVAALLDAQAAVGRVEALCDAKDGIANGARWLHADTVRRALDGTW